MIFFHLENTSRHMAVGIDGAPLIDLEDEYLDSPNSSALSFGDVASRGNSGAMSTGLYLSFFLSVLLCC